MYRIRKISYNRYIKGGALKGAESSKEISASFLLPGDFFSVGGLRVSVVCCRFSYLFDVGRKVTD